MAAQKDLTSKEEKFHAVSVALASMLSKAGPGHITVTQVANRAKVSRAWIYKYIGKDPEDLIRFALEHLGNDITTRDLSDVIESREDLIKSIARGMDRLFDKTTEYPWFVPIYYKYRGTDTPPGRLIDSIEQAYVKRQAQRIEEQFKKFDRKRAVIAAEILTAFRIAIAFSWQRGELKKKASKSEVLASVETWLNELFNA